MLAYQVLWFLDLWCTICFALAASGWVGLSLAPFIMLPHVFLPLSFSLYGFLLCQGSASEVRVSFL